ncbi:FmdE family protein [Sphaerisporangium perillae]|uniref:FmdE family protein n=1 Tax=Sphaerisporangium perillae TaxID=2935860 RepID=UPI00200FBA78|nr:FmdE family protein [Sphaerisporangium perillae]
MSYIEDYAQVTRFHGHKCPGSAVGLRIAQVALAALGRHGADNEIVAVGETDSCAIDSVQVLTGCTLGNRHLIQEDHGKVAFTFWRVSDGAGLRVTAKPGSEAFRSDEAWALAHKVESGTATEEERGRFSRGQAERVEHLLTAPVEDILLVETVSEEAPAAKKLQPHAPCDGCDEQTSTSVLHDHRGRLLCPPCHLAAHGGVLPPDHAGHHHDHHAHHHGHGHLQHN